MNHTNNNPAAGQPKAAVNHKACIRKIPSIFSLLLALVLILTSCAVSSSGAAPPEVAPAYRGKPATVLNHNVPYFRKPTSSKTYEHYSDLDLLGRCGPAEAVLGKETMPTEKRGRIGMIKPSGCHTIRYDDLIPDGRYLYNRCHLIGYQLSGENANRKNLITGTRYMNVEGMEPFENQTADYIRRTGHHVKYRVTPVFLDDDLVARGVIIMEAWSVEDNGLRFCVYCHNVQPGIVIDYATGNSSREVGR